MTNIRFKDYLIDFLEDNNITNKEFANRIGITEQYMIDILEGKADLSAEAISNIALVTGFSESYILRIERNYKLECIIEDYLKENNITASNFLEKFNVREVAKQKFFDFTCIDDKLECIKDILKFLRVISPEKVYEIDAGAFYKSKNDKPELLLLWLEKCYRETLNQELEGEYSKENINILVQYVLRCAKDNKLDEKRLLKMFNKNGVYFVVQDDLPGSKIRGAFRVHRGIPAIYLTHKYKRVADVYFALLHELAHCKTDYNRAQRMSFVSFMDDVDIEEKADRQALDWMVDDLYYEKYCKRPDYDIEKESKFPKAFVAYRLAKDGILKYNSRVYQKYNVAL